MANNSPMQYCYEKNQNIIQNLAAIMCRQVDMQVDKVLKLLKVKAKKL
jgi:hypothetical protein